MKRPPVVQVTADGEETWRGPLTELVRANHFIAEERAEIAASLRAGDSFPYGGGASPLYFIAGVPPALTRHAQPADATRQAWTDLGNYIPGTTRYDLHDPANQDARGGSP